MFQYEFRINHSLARNINTAKCQLLQSVSDDCNQTVPTSPVASGFLIKSADKLIDDFCQH